jgi:5-formyltetrahydrofolate cyclo-ligase
VKVSPDAPQKPVRESVLEQRKRLVVPTPRLRKGFLIIDPIGLPKNKLSYAATIKGSWEYGKPVELGNLPKVDLIVTGSVAVSRDGVRLGKGGGYSEIEYGILRELQRVDDEIMILTTVHDLQMVEEVPADEHDLSVDMIVTPTKVIDTVRKKLRPQGILWDKVTDEMLEDIPILKELAKSREDKAT